MDAATLYSIVAVIGIVFTVVLFLGLFLIATIAVIYFMSYNQKIELWKMNKDGELYKVATRRGKLKKLSPDGNVRILKIGMFFDTLLLAPPKYYYDKHKARYFERAQDKEWINFRFKDMNQALNEANIEINPIDLKTQHALNERWAREIKKEGWLGKNFQMIVNIAFLAIVLVLLIVFVSKQAEGFATMAKADKELTREIKELKAYSCGDIPEDYFPENKTQTNKNSGLIPV